MPDELNLTDEEKALLERRKSPDLTPRQFMLVTEIQNRVALGQMAAGAERDALLAESLGMRDEINAATMDPPEMQALYALNRRLVEFNKKAAEAARTFPR